MCLGAGVHTNEFVGRDTIIINVHAYVFWDMYTRSKWTGSKGKGKGKGKKPRRFFLGSATVTDILTTVNVSLRPPFVPRVSPAKSCPVFFFFLLSSSLLIVSLSLVHSFVVSFCVCVLNPSTFSASRMPCGWMHMRLRTTPPPHLEIYLSRGPDIACEIDREGRREGGGLVGSFDWEDALQRYGVVYSY